MAYFNESDLLLTLAKQSAFGTVPASATAYVLPIAKGSQGPDHNRNKIDNDARYADGYKREFALGNHRSGADLPLVSNLDILGYPLFGVCGSLTTTGTGAPYTHEGKPTKTVVYYTVEEGVPSLGKFYQYVDQVFGEANLEYDIEGLFKPTFKTVGSGKLVVASASMDATPTEVVGPPAEMLNWAALENGTDDGVIQKCSINLKREVIEIRAAGNSGLCEALIIGDITVTGTLTALFKNDTLYQKARDGVVTSLTMTIVRGTSTFTALMPEVKFEPHTFKKQSGQGLLLELPFEAHVGSDPDSPILFTLTNGVASHA